MKKLFVLMAAACAMFATVSCGDKSKDVLAERNQVVLDDKTGKMLPYIVGFDEQYYCETAKGMMPSGKIIDSLSYLAGIQTGAEMLYQFDGLNMDRFDKALKDFQGVEFKDFDKAARDNFPDGNNVSPRFEIDPDALTMIMNDYMRAKNDTTQLVRETLRDSASYIYGVLIGYRMGSMKLGEAQLRKGMQRFLEVDKDREYERFARGGFRDSLYTAYAEQYEIAPDLFQAVMNRYNDASQKAMMENIKIQSRLFIDEAAKAPGMQRKSVEYEEMGDTTTVTKNADILYRFTKTAEVDGPKAEYGDNFTVHYEGRHIDYAIFDQGDFPVNGLSKDGLIKGFTAALLMLREGDEIEVVIPYQLGYGEMGSRNWWGGGYTIYPYETLVFTFSITDLNTQAAVAEEPELEGEESDLDWE